MSPDVTQPSQQPPDPMPAAAAPVPTPSPEPVTAPPARPARETSRLHRLITVGGTILGLFLLYEVVTYFVAFTDDAYVRSDLVAVAPQVTGQIIEVHVVDNQDVKIGDKLYTIDPEPFQLVVNQWKAQIDRAAANLKVAQEELALAQAALQVSTSSHTYAVQEQSRFADLAKREFAPIAELDRANDQLRRSQAEMTISTVAIAKAETDIGAHQAALELAKAQLASAQWNLDRTVVHAPNNGAITNLTLRKGDMATINVPNVGIVDSDAWRIMANYKQYYIRDFKVGDTAWVWLDSAPWHFHKGRITGIARGFSRNPGIDKLLPYVAPTTDWIRLQRRIPVTIVLEELPPGYKLYMGADARTVIFP
ncbi:HlyD family secretion protein [uncultured Reyranella sp.]|uniref:HlyD family secretion protein n=1 Tax=uncultured Reyranella sp. TaxID=735512 RepID=UPI0025D77359|nr:HlyD family secretion protein [uncultured Reyranella sp.]